MNSETKTHRRSFLGRVFGAAVAASLPISGTGTAAQQQSGPDEWIREVKGTHRCLFDFPQHKNGMPLLHILNYLNTYSDGLQDRRRVRSARSGRSTASGPQSSIALAFNDAMWAKYGLGAYLALKDAAGKPYTRNVFNQPTANDLHLLMQASGRRRFRRSPERCRRWASRACRRWARSSCCARTRSAIWCLELEARGKGKAAEIERSCAPTCCPA